MLIFNVDKYIYFALTSINLSSDGGLISCSSVFTRELDMLTKRDIASYILMILNLV